MVWAMEERIYTLRYKQATLCRSPAVFVCWTVIRHGIYHECRAHYAENIVAALAKMTEVQRANN